MESTAGIRIEPQRFKVDGFVKSPSAALHRIRIINDLAAAQVCDDDLIHTGEFGFKI